jgi:hypothetical protein
MDASVGSARPRKRRRRQNYALREDDIETADAFILESVMSEGPDGLQEQLREVPVWTNRPEPNTTQHVRHEGKTKTPNEESNVRPDIPEWVEDVGGQERAGGQGRTRVSKMIMHTRITFIVSHRHSNFTSKNL